MPDWVHRTTKEYLQSVSTASLQEPEANYIQNPDLSAVVGEPSQYWIITGDIVTLATPGEQVLIDIAIQDALNLDNRTDAAVLPDNDQSSQGTVNRALIELFNKRDNYIINRLEECQTVLTNIRDQVLGSQARQNVPAGFPMATSTRPRPDAIQDYKDAINAGDVDP